MSESDLNYFYSPTGRKVKGALINPLKHGSRSTAVIEDADMKDAFERIISSIHIDDDDKDSKIHAHSASLVSSLGHRSGLSMATTYSFGPDRHHVPNLQATPTSSSTSVAPSTPRSSTGHPLTPASSLATPSTRVSLGTADSCFGLGSPTPIGTKSFLDDDWLRERVRVDSNMALVAGGLVRSASATPPLLLEVPQRFPSNRDYHERRRGGYRDDSDDDDEDLFSGPNRLARDPESPPHPFLYGLASRAFTTSAFGSNRPPRDYICKLCSIPGHWLKDCRLFEPKETHRQTHTRSVSLSSLPQVTNSRQVQVSPPGNYICRLCGVPGHWIEQCSKFQPKNPTSLTSGNGKSGETFKNSVPPKNYICNLCHQPGHWIQQCSEFRPLHLLRKRSTSSERGSRFFETPHT